MPNIEMMEIFVTIVKGNPNFQGIYKYCIIIAGSNIKISKTHRL